MGSGGKPPTLVLALAGVPCRFLKNDPHKQMGNMDDNEKGGLPSKHRTWGKIKSQKISFRSSDFSKSKQLSKSDDCPDDPTRAEAA